MTRYAPAGIALLAVALIAVALWTEPARSTGSLTIPNTIAAQSGPNVNASLFDSNWTTIRDYVNNREITQDTLASRPAAGTAGRWYYVNDSTDPGTLYADTGAAWTQVSQNPIGARALVNLVGLNNASTPDQRYDLTADLVVLRNPSSGGIVVRTATQTASNTVTNAGPVANGRDRSAAFASDTWVNVYYIWNGTTLATVSSTCTTTNVGTVGCGTFGGPTMPSGYTHWAYATSLRYNDSSNLKRVVTRGARAFYTASETLVNGGSATSETAIDASPSIASAAQTALLVVRGFTTEAVNVSNNKTLDTELTLRISPGLNFYQQRHLHTSASGLTDEWATTAMVEIPAGDLRYLWSDLVTPGNTVTRNATLNVLGYTIPNGAR